MNYSRDYRTRTTIRVLFLLALTLLGVVASSSLLSAASGYPQSKQEVQVEITGVTMGKIPYKVIVVANPTEEQCQAIKTAVTGTLDRINQLMSPWVDTSDVSRFNRSESTDWISVDGATAQIVQRASEISAQTDGAFDITVGRAVNAWKFGPDKETFTPLTVDQSANLLALTGYEKLSVRLAPPAIKKSTAALGIDLSAIAKGYAVDQVAAAIGDLGFGRYLIEVGGEVVVAGQRPNGGKWIIEIEDPSTAPKSKQQATLSKHKIEISDTAVATSGDYRNYYEFEGKRYSHTISPTTCRPVEHALATASVIADDCMTADAWATAAMVMGTDRAHARAEENGLALLTLTRTDEGIQERISGTFPIVVPKSPWTSSPTASQSIIPAFLATLLVFLLAVVGMAVGAIVANKPVTGSCGGIAAAVGEDGDASCQVCSKPVSDCTLPDAPKS